MSKSIVPKIMTLEEDQDHLYPQIYNNNINYVDLDFIQIYKNKKS